MASRLPFTWRELHLQRPLEPLQAAAVLRQWAADPRSPLVVLEARADAGGVRYLLGAPVPAVASLTASLTTFMGSVITKPELPTVRAGVDGAASLRLSTRHRP